MQIKIDDRLEISAIQKEFNILFPYLKLELLSANNRATHNKQTLADCRTAHEKGEITIYPAMTVIELENTFRYLYGLEIQILRKSGKVWLETSVTGKWSLMQQNTEGEALSKNSC